MKRPPLILYLLGALWILPLTLAGAVLALIYVPIGVRWSDGLLEIRTLWIIGSPGAQTIGLIMFYTDPEERDRPRLRVHERVHVIQSMLWSPFAFAPAWLLHWAVNVMIVRPKPEDYPDYLPMRDRHGNPEPLWWRAYAAICWERQAYRIDHEFAEGKRPGAWGS